MEIKTLQPRQPEHPITSKDWFKEIDYAGNIELINHPLLAIFSSAQCPASQILKAHDYAKTIRNGTMGVISGFRSPVEKEMLAVLLKGTCPIVVVLGRRLEGARLPAAWKAEIEKSRMLVVSPFKEYQTRITKETALASNDLSTQIARQVLIIHASQGGSLHAQAAQWRAAGIPVSYFDGVSSR